jgi:hypothetical protein
MESVPDLPASPELRAFVIWATAGLIGIVGGMTAAVVQRRWLEARRAVVVLGAVLAGSAIGQLAPGTHTWAMWLAIALGIWASYKNTGLSSFCLFIGSVGLAASSLMARSVF